jgi:hypothetical protein
MLVSLKHVYISWRDNGTKSAVEGSFVPSFTMPNTTGIHVLATPNQVTLIHQISIELGLSCEPPFKLQYKRENEGDEWLDITLSDQIVIASAMYHLKQNQSSETGKAVEHRLVHNNLMLVKISLEQRVFEFEIKETSHSQPKEIPSRLIVSDPLYELF